MRMELKKVLHPVKHHDTQEFPLLAKAIWLMYKYSNINILKIIIRVDALVYALQTDGGGDTSICTETEMEA
jgi:hypothetical protein